MESKEKIQRINDLLDKAIKSNFLSNQDIDFLSWKSEVERTLVKIFGKESLEYAHFLKLRFYYSGIRSMGSDHTSFNQKVFTRDFDLLKKSLEGYIKDIECYELLDNVNSSNNTNVISKIFISHAIKDKLIIEEIIELLESIGINSQQIFCSSFEGYGIPLGEDFLHKIKQELSSEVLVLFVLTESFYESKICLCEMGAAWALSKQHIPIVVPPLSYKDIEGVIPLTQGLLINEPTKLNSLKEKLEREFDIVPRLNFSAWERKRDRFINKINDHLEVS